MPNVDLRAPWLLLLALFALLLALGFLYRSYAEQKTFEVTVLDVGKGDAVLVRSPSGATMLIDTGPDASVLRALGSVLPFWDRHIDVLIETSAAASSIGGVPEVLVRYRVGQVVKNADRGTRLDLGDGVYADVLSPAASGATVLALHAGSRVYDIEENTPPAVLSYLQKIDASDGELGSTIIATSTPAGVVK